MTQNEKPNVDDLFARMFGGTKPVEGNPGGEDKEENPPAKKTAAKKTTAKKTPAKKTTTAAKKTAAAKKTTAKKSAAGKAKSEI